MYAILARIYRKYDTLWKTGGNKNLKMARMNALEMMTLFRLIRNGWIDE